LLLQKALEIVHEWLGGKMSKIMPLKPRLSEKTYAMSEALNVYTFEVPVDATKHTVAAAVKAQYDVDPLVCVSLQFPGKAKRTYRKSARKTETGKRSNVRKAYVTLKEGDKLPIFAAVEEANAPEANNAS
jgi:large subunit ribosomal protein L23